MSRGGREIKEGDMKGRGRLRGGWEKGELGKGRGKEKRNSEGKEGRQGKKGRVM